MTNVLKGSISDKKTDQLMKIYGLQWVIRFFYAVVFETTLKFHLGDGLHFYVCHFFAYLSVKLITKTLCNGENVLTTRHLCLTDRLMEDLKRLWISTTIPSSTTAICTNQGNWPVVALARLLASIIQLALLSRVVTERKVFVKSRLLTVELHFMPLIQLISIWSRDDQMQKEWDN